MRTIGIAIVAGLLFQTVGACAAPSPEDGLTVCLDEFAAKTHHPEVAKFSIQLCSELHGQSSTRSTRDRYICAIKGMRGAENDYAAAAAYLACENKHPEPTRN